MDICLNQQERIKPTDHLDYTPTIGSQDIESEKRRSQKRRQIDESKLSANKNKRKRNIREEGVVSFTNCSLKK